MPCASKTKVFTSDSAPCAGISCPFQMKVTPAEFPIRATISRAARTDVAAGAMRVSCVTGWPSAVTETQEFSAARITRVIVGAGFAGGLVGAKVRTVTSLEVSSESGAVGLVCFCVGPLAAVAAGFADGGFEGAAGTGVAAPLAMVADLEGNGC